MKITNNYQVLINAFAFLFILSACTEGSAGADLVGTQWRLTAYGEPDTPTPVIEGTDVTLEFGEDDFAGGSGGCNSYGTQYQVTNGSISFGEIESTLIACLEEGIMEQESAYFNALQTVGEFEMIEDELLIRYNDGGSVLIFTQTGSN